MADQRLCSRKGFKLVFFATLAILVTACGGSGYSGGVSPPPSGSGGANPPPSPAPTVSVSAQPNSVAQGGTATLSWTTTNASSCQASGDWSGSKATSGSEEVGPLSQNARFTLECSGAGGTAQAVASITVQVPAPTVTLNASVSAVRSGTTATLSWTSTNATSCTASGGWSGSKLTSGSEATPPIGAMTQFELTCSGSGGQASDSISVAVNALAGRILLSSISRSDSDVNDPQAPYVDNGSVASAQLLPNPVVVGGYVNEPSRGPEGRSFTDGDLDDLYRVSLVESQIIELVMPSADPSLPDSERDDADLGLFDLNGDLVDASIGLGQVEQLIVPSTGEYYVLVSVWSGAPLYRLSIGQTSVSVASESLRLSDEFIPGEAIAVIKANDALSGRQKAATTMESRYEWRQKAGAPSREMLVELPTSAQAIIQRNKPMVMTQRAGGLNVPTALQKKWETLQYVKMLQADPAVKSASPNYILRAMAVPNDPLYAVQRWHYEMIQLPATWDVTTGNPNVIAAVVDSGVVPHPDLADNVVSGYDFIADVFNQDGDGLDPNPDDPGCVLGGASSFHGTHVAGTISARTNNGEGVAGVAGNVGLMAIRALDGCRGAGNFWDILQGIRYAAGLSNDSGTLPPRRADVINMSLGGPGSCPAALAELFTEVRAQGVIPVAAAGNEDTATTAVPASCPGVVSVSSVGPTRQKASYSNYGASWVDIAAPGGEMRFDTNGDGRPDGVYSTEATGGGSNRLATFGIKQGTSMASPHVAGVVALMKSVNPNLTPAQFDQLLASGALTDDIGPGGPDDLGIGLVNAFKAVRAAGGSVPTVPASLAVNPSTLNFGDIGTLADVVASNAGTEPLSVTALATSASWIQVSAAGVDGNGLGRYQIRVERGALAAGVYSGWVDFASTVGTKRVSVLIQVATSQGQPDTGRQYVLLVDSDLLVAAEQVEVQASGESVPYRFGFVDTGDYYVVSGTDLNNDGFICDDGEACGAYPVEIDPLPVSVEGERMGLDFASTYRTGLQAASASAASESVASREYRRR